MVFDQTRLIRGTEPMIIPLTKGQIIAVLAVAAALAVAITLLGALQGGV